MVMMAKGKKKKRGRPKGKRTEVVFRIKIGRKIIPVSRTRFKKITSLTKPTPRQVKLAKKKLREMGLKI